MPTPKPKYEEPESLMKAWMSIDGVRLVVMATVLADTMIHGEVYVHPGSATIALAQLLLVASHQTLGDRINELGVVVDDGVNAPIDFKWTARNGWESTAMRLFHAERQRRRGRTIS